jgi:perosamine synthetase
MLVTDDDDIADRARLMRLHGISRDAWKRYSADGSWYYEIEDVGFKYNLTDLAAAMGIVQLRRAEELRLERERVANRYGDLLEASGLLDLVEPPPAPGPDAVHAWHLYPVRLRLERLRTDRGAVIDELSRRGIGVSVHFIPLHLHPYYRRTYGYRPLDLPVAAREYEREISLPIYPGLDDARIERVVGVLSDVLSGTQAVSRA